MELKQRKKINNIPKFNDGDDGTDLASIVNSTGGDITGMRAYEQQLNSLPTKEEITQKFAGINLQPKGNVFKAIASQIGPSIISNVIGGQFSQSSKFTDNTSNTIRDFGSVIGGNIPGPYGQAISGITGIAADAVGMWNYKHKTEDMYAEAGVNQNNIGGISYTIQNYADNRKAYKDVKSTAQKNAISMGTKGAALGSALGPIGAIAGGVIGGALGIFGGRKAMIRQKRINRNATMQTNTINRQQMSYADTENMQNRYYQNNRDTTGDILYGANRGKDLKKRAIR